MKNKSIFQVVFLLFWIGAGWAQVVTTEPSYATEKDSITVYFHADRGDQGLMNYSGTDVYAHTGVITNLSTGPSDWKYVKTDWNENTDANHMTKVGDNLWKLTIGYPHQYYGVPSSEKILKLAFVFRNSDGSVTGRDVGGADIFYELYEPGINVVVVRPTVTTTYGDPERSPVFAMPGDSVPIAITAAAIGTQTAHLELRINGTLVAQTDTEDTLHYTFRAQADAPGKKTVYAAATDTSGLTNSQNFVIMVNPPITDEDRPAGLIEGVTYDENNVLKATLCLFAPYKKFVYVIGDFNDWKVDEKYLMHRDSVDADSAYFWLELDNLSPGTEYAYQYLVDGQIRIADPYTEKILDPWNDKYISSSTYPNLKPYPYGKTDFPVSVLQTAQPKYQWHDQNYVRPPQDQLLIYELLVRDFVANHDYKTIIDSLDYLQNLGINAIELMPVTEFEGNESWGYNPDFYFAPDKYYGPKHDLQALVDSCHARGMAVILDMVLNHATSQCPLVRLYNVGDYGPPTAQNPWFNTESPNPAYSWFDDFNHESPATQKFVDRVNRFWLKEYHVDGYRFDFTKGFTNTPGDGWNYDASRIRILKRMADKIWQTDPRAYVILEHFTDNSEETELANYGMMIWGNLNGPYNEATMGYNSNGKSDFSWGFFKTRGWSKPGLVTYMESHDEERIMYKNLKYGNSSGDYNIKELSIALERVKMAGAFFFLLPGPKMIWQFGELGYDYSIDYNGRTGNKPIRWDYFQDSRRRKLYQTFAALMRLRKTYDVFNKPYSTVNMSVAGGMKRINLMFATLNVSVVGNFNVRTGTIQPLFTHGGWWYDFFSGDSLYVQKTDTTITLLAGEFHIFTDQKTFTPPAGLILTGVEPIEAAVPEDFALRPNYPNPFNPTTTIEFSLPKAAHVVLEVFDVNGRLVKRLADGFLKAGTYRVQWNATNGQGVPVSSGLYFYRLRAPGKVQFRKMMLLR